MRKCIFNGEKSLCDSGGVGGRCKEDEPFSLIGTDKEAASRGNTTLLRLWLPGQRRQPHYGRRSYYVGNKVASVVLCLVGTRRNR